MKSDVDQVKSQQGQTPKLVLGPIRRVRQRPVVGIEAGYPGTEHAARQEHGIIQQVSIIVPDKGAVPGRLVGQEDDHHQRGDEEPVS